MKITDLVEKTASPQYLGYQEFIETLDDHCDINIHSLIGAALGMSGESGEFADIIKKHVYQGAELDTLKLKKELGDVLWYVALAANALGVTIEEIQEILGEKLLKRYKNGFTVEESNNRQKDDE